MKFIYLIYSQFLIVPIIIIISREIKKAKTTTMVQSSVAAVESESERFLRELKVARARINMTVDSAQNAIDRIDEYRAG